MSVALDYLGNRPSVLSYLHDVQERQGHVKAMFAGDSIAEGTNYNMGMILPTVLALHQYGIDCRLVGDRQLTTAAQARYFLEGAGGKYYQQTHGGIRTIELIDGFASGSTLLGGGTAGWTLNPLRTALSTNEPDIVFLCTGTNDTAANAVRDQMRRVYEICHQYKSSMPVVHFLPFASVSTTAKTYTVDTGRVATALNGYDAARLDTQARVVTVNGDNVLAGYTWRPNRDATAATNFGSTQLWYDSTHLNEEGSGLVAAMAVAKMAGVPHHEVLDRLSKVGPFQPVPFEYGADVAAAASGEIKDSSARKHVLTSLTATNTGAGTATVTLQRITQRQDGATTGETTTTAFAFKVLTGTTRGWTWPMAGTTAFSATGPIAHYNDGWDVSVATSDCNIQATGFSVAW